MVRQALVGHEMLDYFDSYLGQAAGIATSILWTGTSLLFTAAGRRIGPTAVNASRIFLAIVLLSATHRMLSGTWTPNALPGQVALLAVSGIVGLSIGDQALFTSFIDIGPRLSTLIMTTSPLFAAFFGWLVLGETIPGLGLVGMSLTLGGVAWAVLERTDHRLTERSTHRARGILLALVGAVCQGGGLLLSKQGMGHGWLPADQRLDPQAATLIRVSFAALGVLPIVGLHWFRSRFGAPSSRLRVRTGSVRSGLIFTACGCFIGPFLGVWMSLVASDRAPVGIAQTLCSLTPVFILPFAAIVHKEHISHRAILGAIVAVFGSVLLFF